MSEAEVKEQEPQAPTEVEEVEEVIDAELEERLNQPIDDDRLDGLTLGEAVDLHEEATQEEAPDTSPATTEEVAETPSTPEQVEEIPDLDPGTTPKPDDWQNLRGIAKQHKDAAKEWQEKYEQALKAEPQPPQPAEQPQDQQVAMPDDEVFSLFMKANYEEFDSDEQNRDVKDKAQKVIDRMNPGALYNVIAKANRGELGEHGTEIADLAQRQMSVAVGRDYIERQEQAQAFERQREFVGQFQQSVAKVSEQYPDLKDPQSAFSKYVGKMETEYLGTPDKPGPLSSLRHQPNYPEQLVPLLHRAFLGDQSIATAPAHPETKTKRKQVDVTRLPEAGGHPAGDSGGADADVAALEQRIRSMGRIDW